MVLAFGLSPGIVLGSPVQGSPPPKVKGLRFNPDIFNAWGLPFGTPGYGDSWLMHYYAADVRTQVQAELQSIRQVTAVNAISLFAAAHNEFAWPAPTNQQLHNLINFVNDANAEGLRVILFLSNPGVVPNSALPPGSTPEHVGCHPAGDVVNGWTLFWNVPCYGSDYLFWAKHWYATILQSLGTWIANPSGVSYVVVSGLPQLAFSAEMNVFYDECPFLGLAQDYAAEVVGHLRQTTIFPIGVSLLPSGWKPNPADWYDFLDNLLEAIPPGDIDYLDITSWVGIDPTEIVTRVGAANTRRVILSDFKYGDLSSLLPITQWHFSQVNNYNFGGWWIWQYKDNGDVLGIRQSGAFGPIPGTLGGWRQAVVDAIAADP